jgi:hypothetical protein
MKTQQTATSEHRNPRVEGKNSVFSREIVCEHVISEGILPLKRFSEMQDTGGKRGKVMPVSFEEWEPFGKVLLGLDFKVEEGISEKEVRERREIAVKMSSPEGLFEIINELEGKLARFEDVPVDPEFDKMSIVEKIEKLCEEFSVITESN